MNIYITLRYPRYRDLLQVEATLRALYAAEFEIEARRLANDAALLLSDDELEHMAPRRVHNEIQTTDQLH